MPYLIFSIILAQTINFGVVEFVLGFVIFLLSVGTAVVNIVRGNKKDLDQKVNITEFADYKQDVNSRLSRKVNKEVFDAMFDSVKSDIEEHKQAEALKYKLMREEINIMKQEQKEAREANNKILVQNAEILTEIRVIKDKLQPNNNTNK